MPLRNMAETSNDLYFTAICKLAADCKNMTIASTQELCEQAQLAWMRFIGYVQNTTYSCIHTPQVACLFFRKKNVQGPPRRSGRFNRQKHRHAGKTVAAVDIDPSTEAGFCANAACLSKPNATKSGSLWQALTPPQNIGQRVMTRSWRLPNRNRQSANFRLCVRSPSCQRKQQAVARPAKLLHLLIYRSRK